MFRSTVTWRLGVATLACTFLGAAHASERRPDPTDPQAAVPATVYRSPFAGYVPFDDTKRADWRALNEEVRRAGGHIGIMREQAKKDAAKPPQAGGAAAK